MNNKRIYLSPPDLTGVEMNYLNEIIQSNWIAPVGPHLGQFEEKLSEFTGYKYALAVNSGTSAIHLALLCHGVNSTDSVISSSLTFCGAVNPVAYVGAKLILVDSTEEDWNIDVQRLAEYLDNAETQPSAILITHLFGNPADFKAIESIGKKHNIPVIHDLAEALGCKPHDEKPGQLSESGIVSFNGNKLITTSGGGAFLTNNPEHYKHALLLSTQAKTQGHSYNHHELGYNYRMSNVLAGIGLGQITSIHDKIEKKRTIFENYRSFFENIDGVEFQQEKSGPSDRWLTAIYFDQKKFVKSPVGQVIEALNEENIEARHIWKPMHLQPLYEHCEMIGGEVSEKLFEFGLCLPSGTSLDSDDQERVCNVVANTLKVFQ